MVGKYYIKETSAFTKNGIDECLEWLIKNQSINDDKKWFLTVKKIF